VASYPGPGKLNITFSPPIQTWRFPAHTRENEGRAAALEACRDAVRQQSTDGEDAPLPRIQQAVEAALASLVQAGSISLPGTWSSSQNGRCGVEPPTANAAPARRKRRTDDTDR
jgi:hypothetical protein